MSAERAIEDLFSVCNALYKFTRKPTVAARYKGNTLKRLLEQRWTGHLATVEVILESFQEILEVLDHVENTPSFPADTRMEAAGLRSAVSKPSFRFHALVVQKILAILEPPNRMLQSEEMDLQTAVQLVNSARECILALRTEEVFMELWKECCGTEANDTASHQSKRKCSVNRNLNDYILEQTSGARPQENQIKEQQRLFYSCIDAVAGEIGHRFGERNSKLIESMASLNPESTSFLDPERIKPLLALTGTTVNEAEFVVARQRILKHTETFSPPNEEKWTIKTVLHHFHSSLEAMPSVITAYKAALTLGASTALCENSFSTLKNVFSEHRRSMLHTREACLIQLAFEKDLTRKCKTEWKDRLLRRFHSSGKRRLQLY
uniref:HAT C-terminal dimerisation domain-containing protein n=1 Tax=Nothobranchius kuhntae TaxID=321403 RepID=A0A1A8I409_NOTKU